MNIQEAIQRINRIIGKIWGCSDYSMEDNMALNMAVNALEALEPRVLTREEIIKWDGYIWKEYYNMTAMKGLLIAHGIEREPYAGDFPTNAYKWESYNKLWRIWNTQPTNEQRKAVKWNEDD